MYQVKDFVKLEKLGEGTYGVVYKCMNKITSKFAAIKEIKCLEDDEGVSPTTMREIAVLRELQHPNIVKMEQVIVEGLKVYMVFEYVDTDLFKYLRQEEKLMDKTLLKSFAYQLLQSVLYCHSKRIIHRDLKPQNVLVDVTNNILKLADFGLARFFGTPIKPLTQQVVTLWYRAPEILLGEQRYSCEIDVWSTACIIAEMVDGIPLFMGDCEIAQLFEIFKVLGNPNEEIYPGLCKLRGWNSHFPIWRYSLDKRYANIISDDLYDLLTKMLVYYPPNRCTILDAVNHKYFKDVRKRKLPSHGIEDELCPKRTYKLYKSKSFLKNQELKKKSRKTE